MIKTIKKLSVSIGLMLLVAANAQQGEVDKQFLDDCKALTAGAHRLTGSAEYRKAADYVEARLRKKGEGNDVEVLVQEFQTASLKTELCEIAKADGKTIKIHPMRPNGITPPVTPKTGISGTLIYVGKGDLSAYKTRLEGNSIVVLDYNSREAWIQAFRLGAKAVIFVRDSKLTSDSFHYIHASANLPRYFYNGSVSELPLGETVTVNSVVKWVPVIGRNIIALIKGTDPVFNEARGPESFLFAADLDSYGEVPDLSKGARGAVNCAGLLKLADQLITNRPRRNTVVAFFDGRWNGHMGSSAFYKWLDYKKGKDIYTDTKNALEKETEFLNKILTLANQETPLADHDTDVRFYFLDDLKRIAANHVFEINNQLIEMRWHKRTLEMKIQKLRDSLNKKNQLASEEKKPEYQKEADDFKLVAIKKEAAHSLEISRLEKEIERINKTKAPWNNLRRALNNEKKNKEGSITTITEYLRNEQSQLAGWIAERTKLRTATAGIFR